MSNHHKSRRFHLINRLFSYELRSIFRDPAVLMFCVFVPLGYPLLYSFIYNEEVVREVPVAVVDDNRTGLSREFVRKVDATADVDIVAHCADMAEAKVLVRERKVYGVIYMPTDFTRSLARGEQVCIGAYADLSGMLYYKAILTAATNVSLDLNARIKVERMPSTTNEQDHVTQQPIAYEEVSLFNPQAGFATFLIPAVLILVLHQTLLLGIGILAGTDRDKGRNRLLRPLVKTPTALASAVAVKGLAWLLVYLPVSVYVCGVVPHLFSLVQLSSPLHMACLFVPFLLATIFFAITISYFVRHREAVILLVVFSSVIFLFISGISWPGSAIPPVWKAVGYILPSTFGINAFIAMNNMGASLMDVRPSLILLWVQAGIYFLTACASLWGRARESRQ